MMEQHVPGGTQQRTYACPVKGCGRSAVTATTPPRCPDHKLLMQEVKQP